MKKYFKSFDWIRQVDNAKSLSFVSTRVNEVFSQELYKEFKNILANDEDRFRVSLHRCKEDDLHNMIIAMKKESRVLPHKHKKSESYHLIEGKMLLFYFDIEGNVDKKITMSPEDTIVARVDKDSFHAIIALEDVIYHETRIGPFIAKDDSIFANFSKDKQRLFNEM